MLLIFISITLISFFLAAIYLLTKKKYIEAKQAKKICNQIQATNKLAPTHSLLESHKILVSSVSQMLGKKANAAKLLNKISSRLSNEKEMWRYHRMRNQAAHELDFNVSVTEAQKARQVFKDVVQNLTKN